MWKWTEPSNIKVILLDKDSLNEEYLTYQYRNDIDNVKIFLVSSDNNSRSEKNNSLKYVDTVSLIHQIMEISNCESSQIVAISSDSIFLKEMMQNHIGTVYIGKLKKDALKYVPDFTCQGLTRLSNILKNNHGGYAAEVYVSNPRNRRKISLLNCDSKIQLENGQYNNVFLYFGGRYYPTENTYFIDDPLSRVVIEFKRSYVSYVDDFFNSAVSWISTKEKIDILTYVPRKPSEVLNNSYDRFAPLKLKSCIKKGLVLQCILKCTKDYSQKGSNSITRFENVKGAYELIDAFDVTNKTILILDDVYSTGATMDEIARVLYNHQAKKVIAVLLSVNQMINSVSVQFQHITCPSCGQKMVIKFNHNTGQMFYGCKNYNTHLDKKTLNISEGLNELKILYRLKKETFSDFNDRY